MLNEPENAVGAHHIDRGIGRPARLVLRLVDFPDAVPAGTGGEDRRLALDDDGLVGVFGADDTGGILGQVLRFAAARPGAEVERIGQPDAPDGHDVGAPLRADGRHPIIVAGLQARGRPTPGQQALAVWGGRDPILRHIRPAGRWLTHPGGPHSPGAFSPGPLDLLRRDAGDRAVTSRDHSSTKQAWAQAAGALTTGDQLCYYISTLYINDDNIEHCV